MVVVPPVNAANPVGVARALHESSAVGSPKVVNVNVLVDYASKEMTSIGKLNLGYPLLRDQLESVKLSRENVAHLDFILQSHDKVKTTRVKCYCETLLGEGMRDFLNTLFVIPNGHCFVARTSNHQLLTNASVKASYFTLVE